MKNMKEDGITECAFADNLGLFASRAKIKLINAAIMQVLGVKGTSKYYKNLIWLGYIC